MLPLCPRGGLGAAVPPKDGEEMEPGRGTFLMAPRPLLQQINQGRQGCGSPTHFFIRKKWWEMFKVSVCLYLMWLKNDES